MPTGQDRNPQENNIDIEAAADHWLESDKHSFSWLHCDPRGEKADKLRALDTTRGEAICVPWTPSLGVGGRLSSDLSACYIACTANMCACGLAVAQGTCRLGCWRKKLACFPCNEGVFSALIHVVFALNAPREDKLEVAMHAAWLVGVVGDPAHRPCQVCGTKINPDTGKRRRADTSSCPSQPDLALKVLATAHIATGVARWRTCSSAASKLAELIAEKGTQALCFKGPFDVRLATAPNMTQGRSA